MKRNGHFQRCYHPHTYSCSAQRRVQIYGTYRPKTKKKKIRTRGAAAEVFLIQFISVISHFVRCEHCAVVRCYETCHRSSSFSVFYFIFSCSWWRWHSVLLPTPQQLSWLLGFFREFNRKNLINTSALARAPWWWWCPQGTLPRCRRIAGVSVGKSSGFYIFFRVAEGLADCENSIEQLMTTPPPCVSWPAQNHVLTLFTLG